MERGGAVDDVGDKYRTYTRWVQTSHTRPAITVFPFDIMNFPCSLQYEIPLDWSSFATRKITESKGSARPQSLILVGKPILQHSTEYKKSI